MKTNTLIALSLSCLALHADTIYFTGVSNVAVWHYPEGQVWKPDWRYVEPGLQVDLPGDITSVSLTPIFQCLVDGADTPQPFQAGFQALLYDGTTLQTPYFRPPYGQATIDFENGRSHLYLTTLLTDYGGTQWLQFLPHRQEDFIASETITFGFELNSITFTPVPEPDVYALLLVGVLFLIAGRIVSKKDHRFK